MTSISVVATKPVRQTDSGSRDGSIPPLESGDRLSRGEFERRYEAMQGLKKAELIEGVVYVPSPVRQRYHGKSHTSLIGWLFAYRARTPELDLGANSTVRLDLNNEPQPDSVLFIQPESGGKVKIDEDGYISGAPDLVAEVAGSSASYDLHDKLRAYERNGVREYIVWRVFERQVDWFVLRGSRYEPLAPSEDGILRSNVFPGLWLDATALLRDDYGTLLNVLQRGLDSPEHAAFRAELALRQGRNAVLKLLTKCTRRSYWAVVGQPFQADVRLESLTYDQVRLESLTYDTETLAVSLRIAPELWHPGEDVLICPRHFSRKSGIATWCRRRARRRSCMSIATWCTR